MAALPATKRLSVEEFLAWEDQQQERHEFVDGEIFAMAGASLNHNLIINNLILALTAQLRRRGCFVFHEGAKVLTGHDVVYPDITVVCNTNQSDTRLIYQPSLIVEVLSPSTESYDRDKKWTLYQQLPSLQTYVLVAQDKHQIDVYRPRPRRLAL
jgi:Uma2 family endonuclease